VCWQSHSACTQSLQKPALEQAQLLSMHNTVHGNTKSLLADACIADLHVFYL
jgi:hypothetical protein